VPAGQKLPQIVIVTWDDGVQCDSGSGSADKKGCTDPFIPDSVQYLTEGLKNPDGSPYRFNYYTRQLSTDYAVVENLYAMGHEIADHTITHAIDQPPNSVDYMKNLNSTGWAAEVYGQREIIAKSTNVPFETILGFRSPDLSLNSILFQVLHEGKFLYDSSATVTLNGDKTSERPWGTQQIWPFTLDHGIGGCPEGSSTACTDGSFPGLWEVPINPILTPVADGEQCNPNCKIELAMYPFAGKTEEEVASGFNYNLQRNMNGSRAPFGIYLHTAWLKDNSTGLVNATKRGLRKFLEGLPEDVWVLTPSEVIAWMKAPHKSPGAASTSTARAPARCGMHNATYCQAARPTLWGTTCDYWWTCEPTCPKSFFWLNDVNGTKQEAGCYGISAQTVEEIAAKTDFDPFR